MTIGWLPQALAMLIPAMLAVIGWAFKKIFDMEKRLTQTEARSEDARFVQLEARLDQFEAWREDVANAKEVQEWGYFKKEFPRVQERVQDTEARIIALESRLESQAAQRNARTVRQAEPSAA